MKTTIDIPDRELEDAIRFTNAKTKREAVVNAVADYNRRMRMAELTKYAGTCDDLITPQELQAARFPRYPSTAASGRTRTISRGERAPAA